MASDLQLHVGREQMSERLRRSQQPEDLRGSAEVVTWTSDQHFYEHALYELIK